ncbi:alanine racemase [Bacillota bacterium Meth-B3]|nr:alanine racemase [Christensenellaceae bacterium]
MQHQYRSTELLISEAALAANAAVLMRRLRSRSGGAGGTRMMAVVKADGYGHGALTVAKQALSAGADSLGVALVEEGLALREAGIRAPILVLGGSWGKGVDAAVAHHLSLAVYDEATLMYMQRAASKLDTVAHAHLKIDTGMARVGLRDDVALGRTLSQFKDCPRVKCEGVFTHFANAGVDPEFTAFQDGQFKRALERVRAQGYRPIAHAAASGAMLLGESLHYDMVRPGIALYGAQVTGLCPELVPAQTLVTRPIRIARVEAGEPVGYGCTWRAERTSIVATLPIGYGDGYPRQLSGKAFALVKGRRARLIGLICMDMMMIDVTDVPGVSLKDAVVLLGEQGNERITPDELAELAGTIPYEIMLGFTARVPRRAVPQ